VEVGFGGVLRFPGGQLAMVDSSFVHAPLNCYEIAGSEHTVEEVRPGNQFANEADHFARSIRAGKVMAPAENGVAQAKTLEALYTVSGR
jgi:predicted dehydrogenase